MIRAPKLKILLLFIMAFFFMSCQTSPTKSARSIATETQGGRRVSLAALFRKPGWEYVTAGELSKYQNLWAISDIHGESEKLVKILVKAGLVTPTCQPTKCQWKSPSSARGQLLIVVGDNINKGPDSVGVIRLLADLQTQAASKKGKVILLLGNHEAEILANLKGTNKETDELANNANETRHLDWLGGERKLGTAIKFSELRDESRFGRVLREFSVGAVVGTWMFAHSGFIQSPTTLPALTEFIGDVGQKQAAGSAAAKRQNFEESQRQYSKIADERETLASLISERDWTKKNNPRGSMKEKLDLLGLDALFVGHDPGALNDQGRIAIYDGWLTKLDAGMNNEMSYSDGRILKCPIPSGGSLRLMKDAKESHCKQVAPESRTVGGEVLIPLVDE
ncbi:MAG: metallophosphoesterase [Bdellovibrionales bacterium]